MPIKTLMKLPKEARSMWETTYKAAEKQYGEERAAKIAWASVKKKFKKVGDKWVARTDELIQYRTVRYKFQPDEVSVSRGENGGVTMTYVLGTDKSIGGVSFSKIALKRMAEQINSEGVTGRIDTKHDLYKKLLETMSPEEAEEELQKIMSGLKAVRAEVKDNKLVANVKMSDEVFEKAKGFKAASLEARFPEESLRAGVTDQARLMGFVLTDSPADEDAVRVESGEAATV